MVWNPCSRSVALILQALADTVSAVEEPRIFTHWVGQVCRSKNQGTGQHWLFWGISISHWRIGGPHSFWCLKECQQLLLFRTDQESSKVMYLKNSIYPNCFVYICRITNDAICLEEWIGKHFLFFFPTLFSYPCIRARESRTRQTGTSFWGVLGWECYSAQFLNPKLNKCPKEVLLSNKLTPGTSASPPSSC